MLKMLKKYWWVAALGAGAFVVFRVMQGQSPIPTLSTGGGLSPSAQDTVIRRGGKVKGGARREQQVSQWQKGALS